MGIPENVVRTVEQTRDGRATWEPVVDVNRIVLGAQVVLVMAVLAWRSVRRARARALRSGS